MLIHIDNPRQEDAKGILLPGVLTAFCSFYMVTGCFFRICTAAR